MGCDIHLLVERLTDEGWKRVPVTPGVIDHTWEIERLEEAKLRGPDDWGVRYYQGKIDNCWYDNRSYMVFAVLAGVRNGFGFAGVPTHEPLKPIAEPRGLPGDRDRTGEGDGEDDWDYGDHSYSWVTVEELLSYDWEYRLPVVGVFSRRAYESEEFQAWNRMKAPPVVYSGGVSGRDVLVVSEPDVARRSDWTHVGLSWEESVAEHCADFREIIPALCEIGRPNEVRLVFGFDS